nr:MAG TPA: hypothetical protein [Caudoviricetes sp.]
MFVSAFHYHLQFSSLLKYHYAQSIQQHLLLRIVDFQNLHIP